jgi:hypothetical protein
MQCRNVKITPMHGMATETGGDDSVSLLGCLGFGCFLVCVVWAGWDLYTFEFASARFSLRGLMIRVIRFPRIRSTIDVTKMICVIRSPRIRSENWRDEATETGGDDSVSLGSMPRYSVGTHADL